MSDGERRQYLTAHHFALVRIYWGHYLLGCSAVGLPAPWAFALCGIHFAESGFSPGSPAGEQGGPFCFDPAGRGYGGTLEDQITVHATRVARRLKHQVVDASLEHDFPLAAVVAADELREKAHPHPILSGDYPALRETMGWAAWGYNGRAAWCNEAFQRGLAGPTPPTWRWAPYVLNDPLNGVQMYAGGGTTVGADGKRHPTGERRPAQNPGVLVIADELHTRWGEWYDGPRSAA